MYVTKRSPKLKGSKKSAAAKALNPVLESLENRTLLSNSQLFADPSLVAIPDASASSIAGYTPAQIKTAYGFNGVSGTGAGQVIAIVDAYNDPNISSDLSAFDSQYGLGPASLSVVNQNGSASKSALPATNAGWDLEISLDVEWAHAIAPGASILLVEANSSSLSNLLAAENYARGAKGVTVVSMSWGSSEFQGETADDAYFTTTPGHKGVTFVAASGDEGSWYGPDWPASSPDVLSVGGTTLYLANSSGTYGGETGWSDSTGGISSYEPEPAYQTIAQGHRLRNFSRCRLRCRPQHRHRRLRYGRL
jgi:subtilase family serine protease